jgi:hypothetical protein
VEKQSVARNTPPKTVKSINAACCSRIWWLSRSVGVRSRPFTLIGSAGSEWAGALVGPPQADADAISFSPMMTRRLSATSAILPAELALPSVAAISPDGRFYSRANKKSKIFTPREPICPPFRHE